MPVTRLTLEQYVDIYRKVLPSSYVEPLESQDDGLGMDLAYAFAAMFELADCAINKGTQAYFLREHSAQTDASGAGAAKATGQLQITRSGNVLTALTLPAGVLIEAYRLDSYGEEQSIGRFVTLATTSIGEGSGETATVEVEAEYPGYFGNVSLGGADFRFVELGNLVIPSEFDGLGFLRSADPTTDASDDTWSGDEAGQYIVFESDEAFVSLPLTPRRIQSVYTVTGVRGVIVSPFPDGADTNKHALVRRMEWSELLGVTQATAIVGGNGGMLDDRAVDVASQRIAGETDVALARRLEYLADAVTPAAIARAVDAILGPLGIAWRLLETGDPQSLGGRVWDLHPWDFGSLGFAVSTAAVYDVQGAVWLSRSQLRRFFVLAVAPSITSEQYAAGRVWNALNSLRAAGVGFKFVVDATL